MAGSMGTDGAEDGSSGGNTTGGLQGSVRPKGAVEGTGRVSKIFNRASLNASICCNIADGPRNSGCIGISCGISSLARDWECDKGAP